MKYDAADHLCSFVEDRDFYGEVRITLLCYFATFAVYQHVTIVWTSIEPFMRAADSNFELVLFSRPTFDSEAKK